MTILELEREIDRIDEQTDRVMEILDLLNERRTELFNRLQKAKKQTELVSIVVVNGYDETETVMVRTHLTREEEEHLMKTGQVGDCMYIPHIVEEA